MKNMSSYLVQTFVWSGYAFVEGVSRRDSLQSKLLLLVVFIYIGYLTAVAIGLSRKRAVYITAVTLALFFSIKELASFMFF